MFSQILAKLVILGLNIVMATDQGEIQAVFISPLIGNLHNTTSTNASRYIIIDIAAAAPLFWLLLIPVGGVGCCWCLYRCCSGTPRPPTRVITHNQRWTPSHGHGENDDLIQCYLCFAKVTTALWKSGQHRMECSSRLNHKIQAMPKSRSIFCVSCGEKMRQWPWQGPEFMCDSGVSNVCYSSEGNLIANTGGNRFNCFLCDIDYCPACVHTMETFRKYNYNTFGIHNESSKAPAPRLTPTSSCSRATEVAVPMPHMNHHVYSTAAAAEVDVPMPHMNHHVYSTAAAAEVDVPLPYMNHHVYSPAAASLDESPPSYSEAMKSY